MSPETWIVSLVVALAVAIVAAVIFLVDMIQADEARDRAAAERDAALAAKASQFEASQAVIADLKTGHEMENAEAQRQIAELRDGQWQAFTALNKAQRELALLRPIADSAEKLLDDEKLPGEWAPVRAAIRARKEAGNA